MQRLARRPLSANPQHDVPAPSTDGAAYDAFISYSHAADGRLAPALQQVLQGLGKAWHQRRALRVFRDATSLSASPELWPTIERALERSSYFVLLASPESASSPWVDQEVLWWRGHRPAGTLLIALTGGELRWSGEDFTPESAVPPGARGWFADEPLWADLRWAHGEEHVSTRNPRFLDDVASLAAAIHRVDKDALVGEDERQHRRTLRLARAAVAVLVVLTLVAITGGVLAETQRRAADHQRREAQRQAREATSVALASSATQVMTKRPEVSVLLALEAFRTSPRAEARGSLVSALTAARDPGVRAILHGPTVPLFSVAISNDPRLVVGAGYDRTIYVWDARTHRRLGRPLTGEADIVNDVAFSPNGRTIAAAGADKTIRLWDARTHRPLGAPLRGHTDPVNAVAFSPDGRTLASASDDDTIRLWDLPKHRPSGRPLAGHDDDVNSLAFSADGRKLASGSDDKTVRLWDLRRRRQIGRPFTGHTSFVFGVALSPDGRTLASASLDRTIRLWDVLRHRPLGPPMRGFRDYASGLAFSPDGRTLASTGIDNTIRLWDPRSRRQRGRPLAGHTDDVWSVAFTPDGRT